ncbi:hypothetical protein L1987_20287 [Smallanthus sonchifolius]|uniref:Uncharacterized protein n=1 Tax=Smallanthus sonchifolius TaxID=185202 RepID=A0ACB9ITG0_9ASTR|nr:hypothetical protein L1987_20287 [Smallanthus sonchifolius]
MASEDHYKLTYTITTSADVQHPKLMSEYDEKVIALIARDNMAYGSIAMALPMDVFNIFAEYSTAKDVWVALCIRYEGSAELKVLGTEYPTIELNKKLLDSLPEEWNMYRIMIKKTEKLSDLSQQELYSIMDSTTSSNKTIMAYFQTDVPPSIYGIQPTITSTSQKLTTMIPDEYLPIMTAIMSCYDALISGNLTPVSFQPDNLEHINPDDLEKMDIDWCMAMLTLRAKRFIKRTGMDRFKQGKTLGFDIKKVCRIVKVQDGSVLS